MNTTITAISTIVLLLVVTSSVSSAYAEVPGWVKNNAGWWADGTITDGEFVNGIQHLMSIGLIGIQASETNPVDVKPIISDSSELGLLQAQLDACSEIKQNYDRLNCERSAKYEITAYHYKLVAESYETGPITFYWSGLETDGNSLEITSSGQAMLRLRILVENTGSTQTESLFCTGPAICNYDVTNGDTDFKYSGTDFTNGQIILKPGVSKIFNMFFGPNIGGGGTTFEYDSGKDYHFRGMESYGSLSIPLNLG